MKRIPKLLLLGNGINRAFAGDSWTDVLKEISTRPDISIDTLSSPMPLRAVLVTGNHVKDAMKTHQLAFMGKNPVKEEREILRELMTMGFDSILTTNYSYELEAVAIGAMPSETKLRHMTQHTKGDRVEGKYLLHTFNAAEVNGCPNRIWHIHGEARKPDSMIIGHYYYANLLTRMKAIADMGGNYSNRFAADDISCGSWVDDFILGDVFILGFGFDLSELDLWWLINRKQREKGLPGKVYWFEPSVRYDDNGIDEKRELLKCMGVVCEDLSFSVPAGKHISNYKEFYMEAVNRIRKVIMTCDK